jgi:putative NADH-flavin reductase
VKIAVFGATGRTGLPFLEQALAAGHEVVAFVRDPAKLDANLETADDTAALTVVEGDVLDAAAVARAVAGGAEDASPVDAVVNVLGHADGAPDDVLERGGHNVLAAMAEAGVDRYVVLTGAAVRTGEDPSASVGSRVMGGLMRVLAGDLLEDSKAHVADVEETGLDWTIVRAPRLTDGPHTGRYEAGYLSMGMGETISRADTADFLLAELERGEWVGELPHVTGTD